MYIGKNMKLIYQLLVIFFWSVELILPMQQNTDNITFEYKLLSKKECKNYFKTKKILKKGYQPIQIMVTNHSDTAIFVSPKNLNIPTIPADAVVAALHKNGFARGIPLGLAAIAIALPLPMAMLLPWGVHVISCVGFTVFGTAGIVAGAGAKIYNQKITLIADLAFQDQLVSPHATATGVVFVKSDSLISDDTDINFEKVKQEYKELEGDC